MIEYDSEPLFYKWKCNLKLFHCVRVMSENGIDLDVCKKLVAGIKRPHPPVNSCTDADHTVCVALLGPLTGDQLAKNLLDTEHFKVHPDCYKEAFKNIIQESCLSSCAMCCKAPEFNCVNTGDVPTCAVFTEHKILCTSNISSSIAKAKCPSTCALCANRFTCPDENKNCQILIDAKILNCNDASAMVGCRGTCGLDTCLSTPAPKPACLDEASDCDKVKALNYCFKANQYGPSVTARCRKTCGVCI